MQSDRDVKVWDPLVRVFHWSLVAAFAVAYLSGDDLEQVHVLAGYTVVGLVAFRLVWGFVGTRHARFSAFVRGPLAVFTYLRELATFKAPRHLGHNPAGGAMIVTLLVLLALTTLTGLMTYGADGHGPLAGLMAHFGDPGFMAAWADDDELFERGGKAGEWLGDVHEFFANFTVFLVAVHVGGVLLESLVHNENLVRAMFTGRKRG